MKKILIRKKSFEQSGEKHKWMYDRISLQISLEEIGFSNFTVKAYNDSAINDWDNYKLDSSEYSDTTWKPDSLYIEATKT